MVQKIGEVVTVAFWVAVRALLSGSPYTGSGGGGAVLVKIITMNVWVHG